MKKFLAAATILSTIFLGESSALPFSVTVPRVLPRSPVERAIDEWASDRGPYDLRKEKELSILLQQERAETNLEGRGSTPSDHTAIALKYHWKITRGVLFGNVNFDAVLGKLRTQDAMAETFKTLQYELSIHVATFGPFNGTTGDGRIELGWNLFPYVWHLQQYSSVDWKHPHVKELLAKFRADLAGKEKIIADKIKFIDSQLGDRPLFDTLRFLILLLLPIVWMLETVKAAWELLQSPTKFDSRRWFRQTFRMLLILLFLYMSKNFIVFGITLSDAVKDHISDLAQPRDTVDNFFKEIDEGRAVSPVPGFAPVPEYDAAKCDWTKGSFVDISPVLDGPRYITSPFGVHRYIPGITNGMHKGIDFGGKTGDPVRSPVDGTLVLKLAPGGEAKGHGYYAQIHGDDGSVHALAHLSSFQPHMSLTEFKERFGSAEAAKGKQVGMGRIRRGEQVGEMGSTGSSTGPHLHWDVYVGGCLVSPESWWKKELPATLHNSEVPGSNRQMTNEWAVTSSLTSVGGSVTDLLYQKKIKHLGYQPAWWWQPKAFLLHIFGNIMITLTEASIYVLVIFTDLMMAFTAALLPLTIFLFYWPYNEEALIKWVKSYITLLFYGPLTAVYTILLVALQVYLLSDTSAVVFILLCIAMVGGAAQIPKLAAGLTGVVLGPLALGMAAMHEQAGIGAAGGLARQGKNAFGQWRKEKFAAKK
jgi:hypothetical protein